LQIGLPYLMVSFFRPWANTRPQCSAFIINLGQIEEPIFYISVDSGYKSPGADVIFCSNSNTGFGLNNCPKSYCKVGLMIMTHLKVSQSYFTVSGVKLLLRPHIERYVPLKPT
jgi:hypothetical protein